jgi:hypothetical protein
MCSQTHMNSREDRTRSHKCGISGSSCAFGCGGNACKRALSGQVVAPAAPLPWLQLGALQRSPAPSKKASHKIGAIIPMQLNTMAARIAI